MRENQDVPQPVKLVKVIEPELAHSQKQYPGSGKRWWEFYDLNGQPLTVRAEIQTLNPYSPFRLSRGRKGQAGLLRKRVLWVH